AHDPTGPAVGAFQRRRPRTVLGFGSELPAERSLRSHLRVPTASRRPHVARSRTNTMVRATPLTPAQDEPRSEAERPDSGARPAFLLMSGRMVAFAATF